MRGRSCSVNVKVWVKLTTLVWIGERHHVNMVITWPLTSFGMEAKSRKSSLVEKKPHDHHGITTHVVEATSPPLDFLPEETFSCRLVSPFEINQQMK